MSLPAFLRRLDAETRIRLQPSPISGVGVFAIQPLSEGSDPFVGAADADVETRFVPEEELARLSDPVRRMVTDFCLPRVEGGVAGRWVYLRGFNFMDASFFLNHSAEDANVAMCDDASSSLCVFRTTRDVAPGEELLFDYTASSRAALASSC